MPNETARASRALFAHLTEIGWPDVVRQGNTIKIHRDDGLTVFRPYGDTYEITSIYYSQDDDEFRQPGGLVRFRVHASVSLDTVFYLPRRTPYKLNQASIVKSILGLNQGGKHAKAERLDISPSHTRRSFSTTTKTLKVPLALFTEITGQAAEIYKERTSYGNAIQRYRVNQALERYLGVPVGRTTTLTPGEFAFLVHRFNLGSKNRREDYLKYLNDEDLRAVEQVARTFIERGVFSQEYLRRLDAYFIKERLETIIELGREILDLGVEDVTTDKAQTVIEKLTADDGSGGIGQLEGIWQRYFEKYLLYLIFSYREIHPKVALTLGDQVKYPDFIGVNHYLGIDAIEIKTHLKYALTRDSSHDNFSFSSEMSRAIIQTTNYMDAIRQHSFERASDREKITSTTRVENLHRPRGIIVISRRGHLIQNQQRYDQEKIVRDFTKLRNSLDRIEILTFDEILDMAESYSQKIADDFDAGK